MDTLPIHNTEIENMVLSAIMTIDGAYTEVAEFLQGTQPFYDDMNARIYSAVRELDSKGQPVDLATVTMHFVGEKDFDQVQTHIMTDIEPVYSREYVFLAQKLQEMEMKRRVWEYAIQMQASAAKDEKDVGELISECNAEMDSILQMAPTDSVKVFRPVLGELQQVVNDNAGGMNEPGFLTGYNILDRTGGLHPADLMIIAAESSQGKTALAMNILLGAAKKGTPCAVYSMEMTSLQLAARFVAMESGLQNSEILYKPLGRDSLMTFDNAVGRLENLPVYFDDRSTSSVDSIIASIRRLVKRYGVKVAIVDYIQMLTLTSARRNQTDEQILGGIARRLKNLAKELEICVIAISQLSRDYANPVPSMNRLRASGQIGEAADVVMLLYRPEAVSNGRDNRYPAPDSGVDPKGTAQVTIAKGRNTGLASCFLKFRPDCTRFEEFCGEQIPMLEKKDKKEDDAPF